MTKYDICAAAVIGLILSIGVMTLYMMVHRP